MNTDQIQAEAIGRFLAERLDVLVWPAVTYGYYPAFTAYPGSCSLSEGTFASLASEILACIRATGPGHVTVVNTGISTIAPLEQAVAADPEGGVALINVYEGEGFLRAADEISEQARGGHADELETSIMLALAPEMVDLKLASAWDHRPIRGRLDRLDPDAANYSPDGVYGDPTLATAEKGRRLLEAMQGDVLTSVKRLTQAHH